MGALFTAPIGLENVSVQDPRDTVGRLGVKAAKPIHPVWVAISGKKVGPSLFLFMEALGEERLIGRIGNIRVIDGFHETIEYSTYLFGEKKRHRVVYLFPAQAFGREFCVSFEHWGGAWFEFDIAYKFARYPENRKVLKEAHRFVMERVLGK